MLDLNNKAEKDIFDKMMEFSSEQKGIGWCAALRDKKGTVKLVENPHRPCYGELRAYGKNSTRPNDPKPGDLPSPIPAGIREALGIPFRAAVPTDKEDIKSWNDFVGFLFSKESPWRRGYRPDSIVFTEGKDGVRKGFVMTETDVDPTVMLSLLIGLRSIYPSYKPWAEAKKKFDLTNTQALAVAFWLNPDFKKGTYVFGGPSSYWFHDIIDPQEFSEGASADLSNGRTWRDQEDYNRPQVGEIFLKKGGVSFRIRLQKEVRKEATMYSSRTSMDEDFNKAVEYIKKAIA